MKKRTLLVAILVLAMMFTLFACGKTEHTVTFDADGGSEVASVKVESGLTAAEPTAPTKEGYKFLGWYLGEEKYDFTTPVTKDITLKAKWEEETPPAPETFTVTFDTDGGSAVESQTVESGKTATLPAAPTKAGYKFLGWYVGDAEYDFATAVTGNVTLKAKWEVDGPYAEFAGTWTGTEDAYGYKYDYVLTINADGSGEGSYTDLEDGYVSGFKIKSISVDGSTVTIVFDKNNYDYTKAFTYADGKLTITYAFNYGALTLTRGEGGEDPEPPVDPDPDEPEVSVTLEELVGSWNGTETAYGYDYEYVLTIGADGTGSGSYKDVTDGYVTGFNIKSIAIDGSTVTIVFDKNNYDYTKTFTYAEGKLTTTSAFNYGALTIEKGEGDSGEGGDEPETPDEPVVNVTLEQLVGVWRGEEEYYGSKYAHEITIKEDGTATGWYDYYGEEPMNVVVTINGNKVTIVMQDSYTTISTEFTYTDGKLVAASGDGMNGGTLTEFTRVGDVVIPDEFTVSFNTDGGSTVADQTVEDGKTATAPEVPTKDGYTFLGWYLDGAAYDFATPITKDIVLLAKWEETAPADPDAFAEFAGTWVGTENDWYGDKYEYEIVINADGTGTGKYTDGNGYVTDLAVKSIAVDGSAVTIVFIKISNGYDYTKTFTYTDGKLTITYAFNNGELTLEKSAGGEVVPPADNVTFDQLAGVWSGDEEYYGDKYATEITIKEDGTATGWYDYYGKTDMDEVTVTIDGNKVTISMKDGYYNSTVDFTYVDGKLVAIAGVGLNDGTFTELTKKVDEVPEEPEVPTPEPETPVEDVTFEELAGKWVGNEIYFDESYKYEITINEDGTASGTYIDSSSGLTDFDALTVTVSGNKVTMVMKAGYYTATVEFTYSEGKLTAANNSTALNTGVLNLEKAV